MTQEKEKRKFIDRIRHRYRLVVMNDDTFEENFSLRLTPLGFFILLASVTIVMTMLVTSIIAFTPIREYIPGYADVSMRRDLIKLKKNSDSLEQAIIEQNAFIENVGNVLKGGMKADSSRNRPDKTKDYSKLNLNPSGKEEALKKSIEAEDKYSLAYGTENKNGISNFFFFTPLKGFISDPFKGKEQHFGIDVVGPENESVKATLDGTVILATWSLETGYTMTVQHTNNIISVYKHNSVLLKKVGDYVKAGEAIAIIGNSGEQTTGPHLHFELWYNGKAMNPQDYMVF
ncbi:MAG: peptidase [Bacteroidota bacterium]|jgi:murein DD-endopeptidase MepM/ murein hydrolase activator NlpD|nr:peptidase [Bacteroidota bacterium]